MDEELTFNDRLREKQLERKEKARNYIYYGIIFALSMIMLLIFPFLGSSLGLQWNVPNTVAGWIVYIVTTVCQSLCNVLIFVCFVRQARLNVKDSKNFLEAQEILVKTVKKTKKPKSPEQFLAGTYISKGSIVAVSTVLGFIGLSNAILMFSLVNLIASFTTIALAIVFGIITMKKVELYWQFDYLEYAKYKQQEAELEKQELVKAESDGEKPVGEEKEC